MRGMSLVRTEVAVAVDLYYGLYGLYGFTSYMDYMDYMDYI